MFMNSRDAGFTIVESLLAAFIIILLWFTVFSVFSTVKKGMNHSESYYMAAFLGKTLMENARGAGFDNVSSYSGSQAINGVSNGAQFVLNISYVVNVTLLSPTKKRVWTVMSWQDGSSNKQVVLETLLVK